MHGNQKASRAPQEAQPRATPSARQKKEKERSRARKDAFHARKRAEASAREDAAAHPLAIVHHASLAAQQDDRALAGDDDMRH